MAIANDNRTASPLFDTAFPPGLVPVVKTPNTELYDRLRRDILRCHLKPDARLLFKDLTRIYGSGISQLREALMRLAADSWVVLESHKGFRVAPVSREELTDITQLRCELESMAIRMAIEKGDLRWEGDIMARHHEVSKIPIFKDDGTLSEEWDSANSAFHRALYLLVVLRYCCSFATCCVNASAAIVGFGRSTATPRRIRIRITRIWFAR